MRTPYGMGSGTLGLLCICDALFATTQLPTQVLKGKKAAASAAVDGPT